MGSGPFDEIWTVSDIQTRIPKVSDPSSYLPAGTLIEDIQDQMRWATMSATDHLASAVADARQASPVVHNFSSPLADTLDELNSNHISNIVDLVNQSHVANVSDAMSYAISQARSPIDWSALANVNTSPIDWSALANVTSSPIDWSRVTDHLLSPTNLDVWKSVAFNVRRPEDEYAIYQAARPGIVEVAQELREMYDFSKLKVMTTWLDSPFIADSTTIDLPSVFDLPDEPIVTILRRAPRRHRRKRKPPEFVAPIDQIDTTTSQDKQPLIPFKRIVKEMSDEQVMLLIMGGCTSGTAISEGVGGYVGGAIGGAVMGTVTVVVWIRGNP